MERPNLSYIEELSAGNISFKQKLITIVKEELPKEITIYNENIKKGLLKEASENVHKLKHKISILGLEKSYYLAREFEENLKMGSLSKQQDFEAILSEMTQFINEL